MVDVVVVNYNNYKEVISYIERVKNMMQVSHIVVVDNCSTNNSFEELSKYSSDKVVILKSERNGGYGYGNNVGIRYIINNFGFGIIAVTNPDVYYDEESLSACERYLEDNSNYIAVAAPRMMNIEGKEEGSAWFIPNWFNYAATRLFWGSRFFRIRTIQEFKKEAEYCDCVAGSFLVINSRAFFNAGLYDEKIFLYCEETVMGIKLKNLGYKSVILRDYSFIHAHSTTINSTYNKMKQLKIEWESREYVLKEYFKISYDKVLCVKALKYISILESFVLVKLKEKKDYLIDGKKRLKE